MSYIVSSKRPPWFSTLCSLIISVVFLKLEDMKKKWGLTFKILHIISYTVKLFSALVQSQVVT